MYPGTNVNFRCDKCGHNNIVLIKIGVTVIFPVKLVHSHNCDGKANPMVTTSGQNMENGTTIGFACNKCRQIIAKTSTELFRYLQDRNMIH